MPKMKSNSGAKKRFRMTGKKKIRSNQAGKQHGMVKRSKRQLRDQRGTTILAEADEAIIKKLLPYIRKKKK